MKKDSSKSSLQNFANQQLSTTQISKVKGGNGNSADTTDIVITDAIIV